MMHSWEQWQCATLVLGIQFAFMTSLLTTLDLVNPVWWQQSKLVPSKPLSRKQVVNMLPTVLRNYFLSGPYIWTLWQLRLGWFGHESVLPLPSSNFALVDALVKLLVLHTVSQLWFWTAHRLVHLWGPVFRYVHAAHHVHLEPFALTAMDCSVSEMYLLNLPAVIVPLLLLLPTLSVQLVWVVLAASHVVLTHSGHRLLGADDYHALHHRHLVGNFGSPMLDQLFGTCIKI